MNDCLIIVSYNNIIHPFSCHLFLFFILILNIIMIGMITINNLVFLIALPPLSFMMSLLWLHDKMNHLQQQQ